MRRAFWSSFTFAALAYVLGAAPSVTVRDSGELTTAAFSFDVAHPTGFPVEMVLYRLGQCLPFGDVAFRTNVMVGLLMALAVALASSLVWGVARPLPSLARAAVAAVPAVALVCSPTVVRAATATEVYALALALPLGALMMATRESVSLAERTRAVALLAGLSLALHTTARPAPWLALALLLIASRTKTAWWRALVPVVSLGAIGAAVVVYLPLAARRRGPVDWQHPATFRALMEYLSARSIRASFAHRMLVGWRVPEDFGAVVRRLGEDVEYGVVVLGMLAVAVVPASLRRHAGALLFLTLVDVLYATLLNPMGLPDRQTLFFAEAGFAVLSAMSLASLVMRLPEARRAVVGVGVGALVMASSLVCVDRAWAGAADGWASTEVLLGGGALGAAPPRAVVLCGSDDFCGGALYAQFVEGERPDVVVLPRQHLAEGFTWRRLDPRRSLYPRRGDDRAASEGLRRQRLARLVATFATRVRWEGGDREPITMPPLGTSETPALGEPASTVTPSFERDRAWVRARLPHTPGIGARWVAAMTLFGAGQRAAQADPTLGEPWWREAVTLAPEHVSSWTNLGVVAARRGRLTEAVALTRHALSLDPERPGAWSNLAEYLAAIGQPAEAERARREAARRRAPGE